MHVLSIVSYKFLPYHIGGQKGIGLFNKYFSKKVRFTCVTIQSNDPSLVDYDLLNILSNKKYRYINILYFFTIRRLIKQRAITHLLLEHPYYGWLGVLLKYFCGVKLIVHSHNIEYLRQKTLGKWWWKVLFYYERFTHRQADYNFFISHDDLGLAFINFGLRKEKCEIVTYGVELEKKPTIEERKNANQMIKLLHNIDKSDSIYFFNGSFDYKPNLEALEFIVNDLNPFLKKSTIKYTIIICGSNIPVYMKKMWYDNIKFLDYVDDVFLYYKGCDVFLNPIQSGGGIKTKLIEALAYGCVCVSTKMGAIGIPYFTKGNSLYKTELNTREFVLGILYEEAMRKWNLSVASNFYIWFDWGNITNKAKKLIEK